MVCGLPPQAGREEPTLISCAHCLAHNHRHSGRTCGHISPVPCPDRRAGYRGSHCRRTSPDPYQRSTGGHRPHTDALEARPDAHSPSHLCLPHIRPCFLYKYWALEINDSSPSMDASYAISVRQASVLPAASFRPHLAVTALADKLTVPPCRVCRGLAPPSLCSKTDQLSLILFNALPALNQSICSAVIV